jgi:hypothetical protein
MGHLLGATSRANQSIRAQIAAIAFLAAEQRHLGPFEQLEYALHPSTIRLATDEMRSMLPSLRLSNEAIEKRLKRRNVGQCPLSLRTGYLCDFVQWLSLLRKKRGLTQQFQMGLKPFYAAKVKAADPRHFANTVE